MKILMSMVFISAASSALARCAISEDVEAVIVFIDAKNGFIVIDKGRQAGIGAAFEYEVVRKTDDESLVVGKATFDRFIGQDLMSKLTVSEGPIGEMKIGNRVLCRRKG